MKTLEELILENSLFSTEEERKAFVDDKTKIAEAFVFNFLGVLGLLNGAKDTDKKRLIRYFRSDKKLRIANIGNQNNDLSLVVKLAADAGFFRTPATINEITRFLVKLKTGTITTVNSTIVQNWVKNMKQQEFVMNCGSRIRKIVGEFIDSDNPSLHKLAAQLKVYFRMYPDVVGDFGILARRVKLKPLPESEADEIKVEREESPPETYYPDPKETAEYVRSTFEINTIRPNPFDTDIKKEIAEFTAFLFGRITAPKLSSNFDESKYIRFARKVLNQFTDSELVDILSRMNSTNRIIYEDLIYQIFSGSEALQRIKKYIIDESVKGVAITLREVRNIRFNGKNLFDDKFFIDVIKAASNVDVVEAVLNSNNIGDNVVIEAQKKIWDMMLYTFEFLDGYINKGFIPSVRYKFYSFFKILDRTMHDVDISDSVYEEYAKRFVNILHKEKHLTYGETLSFIKGLYKYYILGMNDAKLISVAGNYVAKKLLSSVDKGGFDSLQSVIESEGYGLDFLDSETSAELVAKVVKHSKEAGTFIYGDEWRYSTSRSGKVTPLFVVRFMFNSNIIRVESIDKLTEKLDTIFNEYYPDADNNEKGKILYMIYNVAVDNLTGSPYRRTVVGEGGLAKERHFAREIILYAAEKGLTGFFNNTSVEMAFDYGIFDDIEKEQSLRILKLIRLNKLDAFFSKEAIKEVYRRHTKRRVKSFFFNLLFDNIDSVPDIVDSIYQNMDTYMQNEMRKELVTAELIMNELHDAPIRPYKRLDDKTLKDVFAYNDLDYSDVLKRMKIRKKKNERISEYIKRVRDVLEKTTVMEPLKVVEVEYDEAELAAISVDYVDKYYTPDNRHGDFRLDVKRMFNAFLPEDKWHEFAERMKQLGVKNEHIRPAFHGTGSIAASMILRYGFAVKEYDPNAPMAMAGRALGDGIYFAKNIDKTAQYMRDGGTGITRRYGSRGYIFVMDSQLGRPKIDYMSGGPGGMVHQHFLTPEWAVRDGNAQLKILQVMEVELTSPSNFEKIRQKAAEKTGGQLGESMLSYKQFKRLDEERRMNNKEEFIFYDGMVYLPDGKAVWYEDVDEDDFPEGVVMELTGNGPSIGFTNREEPVMHHIAFCTSMPDELKYRYFGLMDAYTKNGDEE